MESYTPCRLCIGAITEDAGFNNKIKSIFGSVLQWDQLENRICESDNKVDLLIIDYDNTRINHEMIKETSVAKLGVVSSYKPAIINNHNLHAVLFKASPEHEIQLAANLAVITFKREKLLRDTNKDLEFKLECRRFIILAEIAVMKWFSCNEKDAYTLLRNIAMQTNARIEDICIDLISNPENWERKMKSIRYIESIK